MLEDEKTTLLPESMRRLGRDRIASLNSRKDFFFKVSFLSAFQQNGDQFIRGSKGSLGNVCVYLTLKYPSEIQLVFLTVKYVLISLCYSEKV